jgi:hypothetical protein
MARPNDRDKKAIEQRRAENGKRRVAAAEREKRVQVQVESIVNDALKRPRVGDALPDLPALVERLERAYDLAMVTNQPGMAIKAIEVEARLLGYMIERSAVMHGKVDAGPLLGSVEDNRRALIEEMRQTLGTERTDRMIAIYEGKAEPTEDDESDE